MAQHNSTGKKGELLAEAWIKEQGFNLLEKNWRYKNWELDLIASKNNILHIIEVKTRTGSSFGFPEDNVSKKKIMYLIDAAEEYQLLHPQWKRLQFNILAISISKTKTEYYFIEDIYL